MTDKNEFNGTQKFHCVYCDYYTCRKSQNNRHLLTPKHKKTDKQLTNSDEQSSEGSIKVFKCECGKEYKHRQSIFNHKKKCKFHEESSTEDDSIASINQPLTVELFISLLNQNMELQKQVIELSKEKNTVINNTTNNNNMTNNNSFNLNFFLNEQCKDALNIMDFVNQLKLNTSDLDMVGRVGYTEGITKIIIRGLKELDIFKRPLHCSDLKREVLYVKDKDVWEKDTDERTKLKLAIKHISAKNVKNISAWIEENPDVDDYDSKKHVEYHKIIINATGGLTPEEDEKNYNKIIRNLSKEVVINKDT
jgi:hypothetical protein